MAKADKKAQPAAPSGLDAILQQIQSMPAPAAGATRQPLGPPTEFYGERAAVAPGTAGFTPFLKGDEWTPAYAPPEIRARLQAKMNAAGLYGTAGYQPGVWTNDDAGAYQVILETANARGVADPEQALDLFAAEARVTNPKAKAPRAPLVVSYADPEAVRQVVRKSALDMLGQRLGNADESRIVQAYQAYTTQSQQAQYAASNPEGMGGSYTEPMSAQAFAQAQVEATDPGQLGAQRYLDAFGEITKSLGTLVSAPRTTSGGGVA